MSTVTVGIWIGVILNLAVWSYLFRDNRVYRYVEHIFIGVSAGHALVMGVRSVKTLAWQPMLAANTPGVQRTLAFLSIVMGLLLYTTLVKRYRRISALPVGILLGTGAGLSMGGTIISQGAAQIKATIMPLSSINNVIIIVGVLATMTYFIYGKARGTVGDVAIQVGRVGRWIMMVGFGAAYGTTVMGRVALLTGRVTFLLKDWLHIIK